MGAPFVGFCPDLKRNRETAGRFLSGINRDFNLYCTRLIYHLRE